jgi:hypothetical protein
MLKKETSTFLPSVPEYQTFLILLKQKFQHAKMIAIRNVNTMLITLYYEIGKMIVVKQEETKR